MQKQALVLESLLRSRAVGTPPFLPAHIPLNPFFQARDNSESEETYRGEKKTQFIH